VDGGPDGALLGTRHGDEWLDTVDLAGFSQDCYAVRQRTGTLLAPAGAVQRRVKGKWALRS
jgi:hypothetical protein